MSHGNAPARRDIVGRATGNVHTLVASVTALRRLLDRQADDGTLVSAPTDLIRTAIALGRARIQDVRALLVNRPVEPNASERHDIDGFSMLVAEVECLLDNLEQMRLLFED